MDLKIAGQHFFVGGATSGLGKAVAEALMSEGAIVTGAARKEVALVEMKTAYGNQFIPFVGDLSQEAIVEKLIKQLQEQDLHGLLINAGGPPAMPATDTSLADWDHAYQLVLRWKVQLINALLPRLRAQQYGRIVFIESMSVKQPVANLVLSNSLRLAVVGWVKTLSQEVANQGITLNILGPGFHDTPRITGLLKANSERSGQPEEQIRSQFLKQIPTGFMGRLDDFGALAAWLLSPQARYLTGQTISVDGGVINHSFG